MIKMYKMKWIIIWFLTMIVFKGVINPNLIEGGEKIEKEFFGIDAVPFQRISFLKNTLYVFEEMGLGLLGRNRLSWKDIEPRRPKKGKHFYQWKQLDREFKLYHDAGFQLQIVLQSRSPWGTVVSSGKLPRIAGSPPKKKNWKDWGDFVYELVERYDGDGYKDAFPMEYSLIKILSLHGEIEFPGNWKKWGGTYEDYHRLMRVTSDYAKKANSKILIARAGTSMGPLFDTDPPIEMIKRMSEKSALDKEVSKFLEYTLDHPGDFDIFAIHANRDYTGIEPFVRLVRNEMKKKGYMKPIFIEDGSSVYAGRKKERFAKAENEELIPLYHVLNRGKVARGFEEARRKVSAHQAILTIKKATLALYSGVKHIIFSGYLDKKGSPAIQLLHGGFIDTRIYAEKKDIRLALKPVYYSMKLFLERVVGSERDVKRIDYGKDVYVFEFRKDKRPFYILWCEGRVQEISLSINSLAALKTQIITEEGKVGPRKEKLLIKNGKVQITLNKIPVFLEGIER